MTTATIIRHGPGWAVVRDDNIENEHEYMFQAVEWCRREKMPFAIARSKETPVVVAGKQQELLNETMCAYPGCDKVRARGKDKVYCTPHAERIKSAIGLQQRMIASYSKRTEKEREEVAYRRFQHLLDVRGLDGAMRQCETMHCFRQKYKPGVPWCYACHMARIRLGLEVNE